MLVRDVRAKQQIPMLFEHDVTPLIENVAVDGFPNSLFRLVHKALGCVHLNAFSANHGYRRRLVLAENTGTSEIARHLGSRYIDQFWGLDPVNHAGPYTEPGVRLFEIGPQDISDPDYRNQCYTSVGVGARLSVCDTRPEGLFRINFYRQEEFSDREKDAVVSSLGLLLPLLRRHSLEFGDPPKTAAEFECRLRRFAPELTDREREVCALIALGVTSEGIGLELGISLNTVLTYRKRAYARLQIVSQNQLLRLVCQEAPHYLTNEPIALNYPATAAS